MERFEWLIEPHTGVFQDPALGCFTEDSIALAHFFSAKQTDTVLDLGTGNGVLCLYAEALYGGAYTGIDVNEKQIALARRSAERNGQAIRFEAMRVEDAPEAFGHGTFTRVLMNPPYFTSGDTGRFSEARHADETQLLHWCRAAFLLLKNGGRLTLCYPAERIAALFRALDQSRFAPKRMQFLLQGEKARLILLEAKKDGADGVTITAVPGKNRSPVSPPFINRL